MHRVAEFTAIGRLILQVGIHAGLGTIREHVIRVCAVGAGGLASLLLEDARVVGRLEHLLALQRRIRVTSLRCHVDGGPVVQRSQLHSAALDRFDNTPY